MHPALVHLFATPKRWLPALGGGLVLLVAASWMQGPKGLAVGTWTVTEEDLGDYSRDHWGGPAFSGLFASVVQLLGIARVEIELAADGTYIVTSTFDASVLGRKLGHGLEMAEVGAWTLSDASLDGGTIRFAPQRYDLVSPKDRHVEDVFRRVASLSTSKREFVWETIDANTLLWRPSGVSSGSAPIRIRRK